MAEQETIRIVVDVGITVFLALLFVLVGWLVAFLLTLVGGVPGWLASEREPLRQRWTKYKWRSLFLAVFIVLGSLWIAQAPAERDDVSFAAWFCAHWLMLWFVLSALTVFMTLVGVCWVLLEKGMRKFTNGTR